MFYCDPCRVKKGWPAGYRKRLGKCDFCPADGVCHERPSTELPSQAPSQLEMLKALARSVSYPYRDVFNTAAWAVKRIEELEKEVAELKLDAEY
jgi:hypothetical protein